MKYHKLLLAFSAAVFISGCETMGGLRLHLPHHHMHMEILNKPICKHILQNEIGIEFILKQTNTIFHRSCFTLESQANWIKSTPVFSL